MIFCALLPACKEIDHEPISMARRISGLNIPATAVIVERIDSYVDEQNNHIHDQGEFKIRLQLDSADFAKLFQEASARSPYADVAHADSLSKTAQNRLGGIAHGLFRYRKGNGTDNFQLTTLDSDTREVLIVQINSSRDFWDDPG